MRLQPVRNEPAQPGEGLLPAVHAHPVGAGQGPEADGHLSLLGHPGTSPCPTF